MAGQEYTILEPKVYIAALGSVLPSLSLAYGAAWPAAWIQVHNTTEGAQITPSAPQEQISSDERSSLGLVSDNSDAIMVAFTSMTPSMDLMAYLSNFDKEEVAAVTGTDPEPSYPAYERFSLNKQAPAFMVGIEGKYAPGGLDDNGGKVRAFGYKVKQTEETELQFRSTGADAVLQPAANLQCLFTQLEATQLEGTGIQGVDERFDMFKIAQEAAA